MSAKEASTEVPKIEELLISPKLVKLNDGTKSCPPSSKAEEPHKLQHFDPSTSDFVRIVKKDDFVDKTHLIPTIFEHHASIILITAPRRFGKSSNMDMLKRFLEIPLDANGNAMKREDSSIYGVFKTLKIYQDRDFFNEHFAKYPVIHADFKTVRATDYLGVLERFRNVIQRTFQQHGYLLDSDRLGAEEKKSFRRFFGAESSRDLTAADVESGLLYLSQFLFKHFQRKVFILIDEYDAPINNAMLAKNTPIIDEVNNLLCQIFSNTLKSNNCVDRALLTGISYFATVGLSGVNNVEKHMFLDDHPFAKFYGLTEPELDELLAKFDCSRQKKNVTSYYNGYCSKNKVKLFCMWSVLHYLNRKHFKSYWQDSGIAVGLKVALGFPMVRCAIEEMLRHMPIKIQIYNRVELDDIIDLKHVVVESINREGGVHKRDLYLNFLLQQGYLTYLPFAKRKMKSDKKYKVKIPNEEIRTEFWRELRQYYAGSCKNQCMSNCANVINQLTIKSNHEMYERLISTFQDVIQDMKRNDQILEENERMFHSCLFGVLCKTKYGIADEYQLVNPRRRPDLIICCKNVGMIFELKYKQNSKAAVEQIIKQEYYKVFDNKEKFSDVKHTIFIGLNVKKNCKVTLHVLVNDTNPENAIAFPRESKRFTLIL